jgi:hypothetical protein
MAPDEIWDEHRWEAFLHEHDRQLDRFMNDLYNFMRLQPPPSERDHVAYRLWKDNLGAFLHAKGWKHLGFLSADGEGEHTDGTDDALSVLGGVLPPDEAPEDLEEVHEPPVYRSALLLGGDVLGWANSLPGYVKDSTLVQFCSNVMEIASNVAKGHDMGYEQEMIGGNIACVKRALNAANAALEGLHEMRTSLYMGSQLYAKLYEQTYEVRNGLALYILDLRERFNLGVD